MNKEQELTKNDVMTALCSKQEEYIKELEKKLKTPSDTEKCCEPEKSDYDELVDSLTRARDQIRKNERLILALEKSASWLSDRCDDYDDKLNFLYKELTRVMRENTELKKELEK